MRTILIGVTGASSSGKSTLACLIKRIFPHTEIIHEDDFYKPESEIPYDPVRKERDWDCPDAIDISTMKQTLSVLADPALYAQNPKATVRDTGMGYYDYAMNSTEPPIKDASFDNDDQLIKELAKTANKRLMKMSASGEFRIFLLDGFLLLPDSELLKMLSLTLFFKTNYQSLKNRREKRTYNVEGGVWQDPPGYFDVFVWPGYYTNHKRLFVNGENESYIKTTGGNLKQDFMKEYSVFEFDNNDHCDANKLIEGVTSLICDKIC